MTVKIRNALYALLGGALSFFVSYESYAEIKFSPALQIAHYWTDNRSLAVDALREEDEIIKVQPAIALELNTRRHEVELVSTYKYLVYRQANESREFQEYLAKSSSILVSELLFLNLAADKSSQTASQQDVVAFDSLSLIGNRTDTSSYKINPYLVKNWGALWRTKINYNYMNTQYDTALINNSQAQELTGLLGYGDIGDKIRFDLSYMKVKTESDSVVVETEFDEIRLETFYQVNTYWIWLLNVGYENNGYDLASGGKTEGGYGEIGAEWMPTRKVTLSGTIGEHYYGNSASLRILYQYNKQSGAEVEYRNELTQQSVQLIQSGASAVASNQLDAFVNTFLATEVYEIRHSRIRLYYQLTRSLASLTMDRKVRDFQLSLNQEIVDEVQASWSWNIAPKSVLAISTAVRDREVDGQIGSDRLLFSNLKLQTSPVKNVLLGGEYGVMSRSAEALTSYKQSKVGLFASISFQ